jgi:L-fuculose-phosphate aldolase
MEYQKKRDIIEIGRRLHRKGFVASNDGNISIKVSDHEILATVTGVSKGFLSSDDVVVVDPLGRKLSGGGEPSSELKMHLVIYEKRPDVKAVVHAHPPVATGFAVAGIPLAQCILPEVVVSLGAVPVADYGTPSTLEVCDSIASHVQNAEAFLLANHGAVTMGEDVFQAYYRMETVEHFAKILLTAKLLGRVNVLSPAQVEKLVELRKKSGVTRRLPSCETCGYCGSAGQPPGGGLGGQPATGSQSVVPTVGGTLAGARPAGAERRNPPPDEKRLSDIITAVIKEMTQEG